MPANLMNDVISEYRRNFYKIYHSDVMPILIDSENKRKSMLGNLLIIETVLITLVFFLIKQALLDADTAPIFIIPSILIIIGIAYLPFHFNGKFTGELKNTCMRRILKAFGDIQWLPKTDKISNALLNESDLFSAFNLRTSDDAFWGSYKGVKFSVSETSLLYESGSGKNRTVQCVFKGVVINFESNKTIKNKTIIATKGDNNIKGRNSIIWLSFLGLGVQAVTDLNSWWIYVGVAAVISVIIFFVLKLVQKDKEILNEIKLEDPEFNKKYKAYSSDEIEGRYLITPAFMERFNNVKTAFGANKIKCSFYNQYLMFAITSNKNLFEIGNLFHKLNNPKQMTTFFEELVSILVLVDYFKLDEQTKL